MINLLSKCIDPNKSVGNNQNTIQSEFPNIINTEKSSFTSEIKHVKSAYSNFQPDKRCCIL